MSRWTQLIEQHRAAHDLGPWGRIPEAQWPLLASQCGPAEIAEVKQRLAELDGAAQEVPDWDGDTQDDIAHARMLLTAILRLADTP